MKSIFLGLLFTTLTPVGISYAEDTDAKNILVRVMDTQGLPIQNAWVRLPQTEGRRMVDETGKWQSSSLYDLDGNEIFFTKGKILDFTISAPGYTSRSVAYEVRGRRNLITVQLEPMVHAVIDDENDENLMIRWFQRTYVENE